MRGYQEYRGRSIRLVYDREQGEFVYRVEPHPFLVRTSEAKVRSDARGCDSKAPSVSIGAVMVFEAPGFVAGLDDLAMVGETIEQRGRHLGIAEDGGPFSEGQIGGEDDRGALVEPADQMEQQLSAGLGER